MRRRLAAFISVLALAALALAPAAAADFPEQPGGHVAQGCQSILTQNPSFDHSSDVARGILGPLIGDACFGG